MGMLYDVRVMNDYGVWQTDLVTGSRRRALERGRHMIPRVPALEVRDSTGRRLFLDEDHD